MTDFSKPLNIQIYSATPQDTDTLFQIETRCFATPWSKESFAAALGSATYCFLIAKADEAAVGFAGFCFAADSADITHIATLPSFRRFGIADRLLSALLCKARTMKIDTVSLEVRTSNLPAVSLYRKHHFSTVGLRRGYYTNPREDALIMNCKI